MKMFGKLMHFNRIKNKYLSIVLTQIFCICGILFTSSLAARDVQTLANQSLTQQQYNQLITHFTNQVNATKKILDQSENADATAQRQAFCSRLEAYQHIAALSKDNLQLETASVMLMVANQFLDRQKQSLIDSGMTEQVFCAAKPSKLSENDIKMAENDK